MNDAVCDSSSPALTGEQSAHTEDSAAVTIAAWPEGRDGIYLADRQSLKVWIEAQGFDQIHNLMPTGALMLGADHEVAGVLRDIDRADKVAVLTGQHRRENLNHALALIMPAGDGLPERLAMYDIGEVTDADLTVLSGSSGGEG